MTARLSRWTLALLVALIAVGMSFGSVSAAPAASAGGTTKADLALSRMYKAEQQRLKLQDARLKRVTDYTTKIDGLIAKLKAKGKDTAALKQAAAAVDSPVKKCDRLVNFLAPRVVPNWATCAIIVCLSGASAGTHRRAPT